MLHMVTLIPLEEFQRVRAAAIDQYDRLALIADMCRANTLASVKRAGSGHLGSSFSAMDIVVWLYYAEMNTVTVGVEHPDRDIYFSSKGHDVPGQYAILFSLGILPKEQFTTLRRLEGTCGHPDVSTSGIEANSGSLGMGISKAKGMAFAKRLRCHQGRVFVMNGDGEMQEGQVYEALQAAAHQRIANISLIIDHNKVQSDKPVRDICDLGDLETKLRTFGWHVARCDGHDFRQLEKVFAEFKAITDTPKVLIADTIKGRGVSFMEHPTALKTGGGLYRWHSGAPDDRSFTDAYQEIVTRIQARMERLGLLPLAMEELTQEDKGAKAVSSEYVADAFGRALVDIAAEREELVVLDADLAADCRIRAFELTYPERFIENGIAEQDMVSMAGGLALQGLLPVVNTFAAFLASRANEQIYNNACEQTKIIYVCHYAGLIPAGPGQSHQSIRDISLVGALPNLVVIQPCNAAETRMAVEYCVKEAEESCVLRLVIGPSPRIIELPQGYRLEPGRGVTLVDGRDAVLFAYGPIMLHEALLAAEILRESGFHLKVVNMPWINRVHTDWLQEVIDTCRALFVLEDHAPVGGLGDTLLNTLTASHVMDNRHFQKFGIEGYPAWGTPSEVLKYHGLDGASLAARILKSRDSASGCNRP
ncbi:MAG: 1-deoxy-D-xylulose-5-phosphate synthase [bacterium]|uniref:1-deoxy-D-xylulose-5-phosphate synthase n=1 Tax=Candidatus Methylomirabilis tolerans TaxID=3123416 RepID=A0AAJ1AI25_9BACT|nr:1-deoxy-D-xylulose-5-phosphate synthase [Candidatus Methylomirabilis sp.]